MPRSSRYRGDEIPATVQRSCPAARELFTRAWESAARAYGEGDRAYRAAFSALKEKFEKKGDLWIAKADPAD